ncbi:GGDEF domain-containing protein [Lacisediminihabitans changchengi]|uniref:Diguanylate cyclase n=1 Tax=Lacisediminihabitans changchengi TaxID=2787634 RepID=A0A934SQ16_9MICO|nr:diguanylate cyclase [Lacisediminihabitans changchengi]MBK4346865.1 diguanylate cyclase [Lacisediminihabitans changchengi]MBK4348012.1 diguanylate cyclase [Lacisediminihabitans changchengi]
MILDATTLSLVEGLVFLTTGATFILGTVLGRTTAVGRVWSAAFAVGILAVMCFGVSGIIEGNLRTINAIGCAAFSAAIAIMWSGCRVANGRGSLAWVAAIAASAAGPVVYLDDPAYGQWAGSLPFFLLVAVLAALVAVETLRGRLLHDSNASALTAIFAFAALFYLVRAAVVAIVGVRSPIFLDWFGSITTSMVVIVLILVAGISMSALRNTLPSEADDKDTSGSGIPGIAGPALFDQQLRDWLRRARIDRSPLMLSLIEVDDLDHLTAVFGREFGDLAILAVGRAACESSPIGSVVGQVASRRFAVISVVADARRVADDIQNALVDRPLDSVTGIRAVATIGAATTVEAGYREPDLIAAAQAALDLAIAGVAAQTPPAQAVTD